MGGSERAATSGGGEVITLEAVADTWKQLLEHSESVVRRHERCARSPFRKAGLGPDEAARRATLLMYAAEGAVTLARAQRSIEPLVFTAEQLSTGPGE